MNGTIYRASKGLPRGTAPGGQAYVYVVAKDSDGPIKVGIATNAHRRACELENSNGHRFPLIWLSEPCANFRAIEASVHECMRPVRLLGEWFDVPFDFAVTLTRDVLAGRQRSRTRFSGRAA